LVADFLLCIAIKGVTIQGVRFLQCRATAFQPYRYRVVTIQVARFDEFIPPRGGRRIMRFKAFSHDWPVMAAMPVLAAEYSL
jgi:hypothetical protein